MANQITHIVLSAKISDRLFPHFDRKQFLVGTVFPDIRYLGVIEREKTHFVGLYLDDVLNEPDSFIAGMKYHSLVDKVREAYMVKNDIYKKVPEHKFITQSLKTFEDEVLYNRIADWTEVRGYFDSILSKEKDFGIKDADLERWHKILRNYFSPPLSDGNLESMLGNVMSPDVISEMMGLIKDMRGDKGLQAIIEKMYEDWSALLLAN